MGIYIGIQLQPKPLQPEIIYGEFPFRLECEINGLQVAIQDTLICEYDGIGTNKGQGKHGKWKQRLASGKKNILLLKIDDSIEIYYDPGDTKYYMGDLETNVNYNHNFPNAMIIKKEGRITSDRVSSSDELLNKYNIKLIHWDYTKPIINKFSTK